MTTRTTTHAFLDLVARRYLRKPDQAELLRIKFPDAAAIGAGLLNELCFRLRLPWSFRLTTLNIEITNRCNLRCGYCPVNRSMARPKSDLPLERFREILERAPGVTTLLPFQWGEPLLHPGLFRMLEIARRRGLRTFLTTNGTLLDRERRRDLLRSGVARLTVSVDGDDRIHRESRGVDLAPIRERVRRLRLERDQSGSPLRIDVSMVLDERTAPALAAFRAAWRGAVDRVQVIPRMIAAPRRRPCREPWRGLLVVLADGRVTTCCADSEGRLALGSVDEGDAGRLFNGPPLRRLRRAHARGDFPDPCRSCGEYLHPEVSPRFE